MIFRFKYKLVKNIVSKYFDVKTLNLGVANENTFVNLGVFPNEVGYECSLSINKDEDNCIFNVDEKFVKKLNTLKKKFLIAEASQYLSGDDTFEISDGEYSFHLKTIDAFGFPAVLIGDGDYLLASPVVDEYSDADIEGIVFMLNKLDSDRGFPDESLLKIKTNSEVLSRLSFELLDSNIFE